MALLKKNRSKGYMYLYIKLQMNVMHDMKMRDGRDK